MVDINEENVEAFFVTLWTFSLPLFIALALFLFFFFPLFGLLLVSFILGRERETNWRGPKMTCKEKGS